MQSQRQPQIQPKDGVAVTAAFRRLENKMEAERQHVAEKLHRLEKRLEEFVSTNMGLFRWAELQGHMDSMSETVQDLVRRMDTKLPGDMARAAHTAAARYNGSTAPSPAFSHLSARISALEAWNQAAMPETIVDALEQVQKNCDRQLEECKAEIARQTGTLVERFTAVEKRVSFSEREIAEGVAQLREQVSFCQVDASNTKSIVPAAESGTANGRGTGCGASRRVSWEVLEDEDQCSSSIASQEDRIARLEGMSHGMHQQLVHLDSKFCFVERALHDLEHGMDDIWMDQNMRQQIGQVDDQLVQLALLRGKAAFFTAAPSDSAVWELQSEVSAITEDVLSIRTQVRWIETAMEKMSAGFTRVCGEVAGLRRNARCSAVSPWGRDAANSGSTPVKSDRSSDI